MVNGSCTLRKTAASICMTSSPTSSVGGGALPVPLVAPCRCVERLKKRRGAERGGAALCGGVGVERRTLVRHPAERTDQRLHVFGRHLLAVHRAGGSGNAFIH